MKQTGVKLIANNKKAYHEYFIEESFECGIALTGTEVKSIRMNGCSLKESFIRVRDGEVFIFGMHVAPYEKGNIFNVDPLRVRKLLLHKKEISRLFTKTQEKGLTIMPLEAYFKDGRVKLKIALARGKKLYDKRESLKQKAIALDDKRNFKDRNT